MPGFCVQLGYGLHYGWAIEGAIGSKHKIDASYLSPHVNMASRLEAATKQVESVLQLHHKQSAQKLRMLCTLSHVAIECDFSVPKVIYFSTRVYRVGYSHQGEASSTHITSRRLRTLNKNPLCPLPLIFIFSFFHPQPLPFSLFPPPPYFSLALQ
jgi:hypothetical protein